MKIRLAEKEDLHRIVDIYNQSIPSKCSTADTELFNVDEKRDWFNSHIPDKYPIFVVEIDNNVVGWNSLSPYRGERQAFRHTLETSYYIDENYRGKGIGTSLLEYVIENSPKYGVKTLLTFIMAHNEVSIRLMNVNSEIWLNGYKFGFELWGKLPNIADFDEKEFSHFIFGKRVC